MSTVRFAGGSAVFVALFCTSAFAAVGGDAGSGVDAGGFWWSATSLAYGSYAGSLSSPSDRDWFRFPDSSSTPVCVDASFTPDAPMRSTIYVTGPSGTRTVTLSSAEGVVQTGGVVVSNLWASHLGVSAGPGNYSFAVSAVDLTQTTGDAGADAGEVLAAAASTDASCISGGLAPIVDEIDLYRISALAGETIYYSNAATTSGVSLSLLDASGAPVGLTIGEGEMAGYFAENGGTYYLSASSAGSSTSANYLIGLIIGPEPPGQGCRPTCLVSG